jgi:hypothetical protein
MSTNIRRDLVAAISEDPLTALDDVVLEGDGDGAVHPDSRISPMQIGAKFIIGVYQVKLSCFAL